MSANKVVLLLSREFDAPKQFVYKAWSEAERMKHWWGPKGLELNILKFDFRPDGIFHYSMVAPDGTLFGYGRFVFHEIVPNEKIVFVNSFADEEGNVIRAAFSEVWPLEIHNTLTFSEAGGKTKIAMSGYPLTDSEAELAMFESMKDSMNEGFGGTFDQLDAYLASVQQ